MTEAAHTEQGGTESKLLRFLANVVSYILHPMFMPLAMTYVLYILSPVSFAFYEHNDSLVFLFISIAINTILFPLVLVLLAKGLGFVNSLQMRTRKERIIPMIGTMVFYWWISHKIGSDDTDVLLQTLLRGAYWSIIVLFICSIFFKVSMHTAGAGGMLGILTILLITSPVEMSIPFFISIIVAGIIGTARLLLGAHTTFEIVLGYIIGFAAQFAAYWWVT